MIRSDVQSYIHYVIHGPTLEQENHFYRFLEAPDTTEEKIKSFIQDKREWLYYDCLRIVGNPKPSHEILLNLCSQINGVFLWKWKHQFDMDLTPTLHLVKKFSQITHLALSFDSTCYAQLATLIQLTSLSLSYCENIQEQDCQVLSQMKNLIALRWSWINCQHATPGFLTILSRPLKIKVLDLNYANDLCSRVILNRFSNLEKLDLSHQNSLSLNDDILKELHLPALNTLNLSNNSQLTHQGIKHLTQGMNLTDLSLACCENIDDLALQFLAERSTFQALTLHGCPKITESGLTYFKNQNKLIHLTFGGGEALHNLSFIKFLTHLTTLYIEHSQLDEDPNSLPMLTHLKNLKLLTISDAPHINDTAIQALQTMVHLRTFQLWDSSITELGQAIVDQLNIDNTLWIG